jgi:peptidoglycan L-alanyl-D-glutamate endopeptidase CwlK
MFRLSEGSAGNLEGVHPTLVRAVKIAITITEQDFCILPGGGVRSVAAAADNAKRGVGVVNSLHIPQLDGYSHAVDLVAYVGGPTWDKRYYPAIRRAMLAACDRLLLPIQHGADWDCDGITGEKGEWDWPHFQLPKLPHRVAAAKEAMNARLAA